VFLVVGPHGVVYISGFEHALEGVDFKADFLKIKNEE
jgi:hypothetical protein